MRILNVSKCIASFCLYLLSIHSEVHLKITPQILHRTQCTLFTPIYQPTNKLKLSLTKLSLEKDKKKNFP